MSLVQVLIYQVPQGYLIWTTNLNYKLKGVQKPFREKGCNCTNFNSSTIVMLVLLGFLGIPGIYNYIKRHHRVSINFSVNYTLK
jgi:hypothetical protein